MKNLVTRFFKEEEGQALTEYGLIVGLIAVACIAVLATLGTNLNGFFTYIKDKLGTAPTP